MAKRAAAQQAQIIPSMAVMAGGLDLVTSPLTMKPGRVLAGYNYEPVDGGYKRMDGIERFSGLPRPSQASYWFLSFDAGNTALTTGQTVTGLTSGATGVLLVNGVLESGSYGASNAVGYLVLTNVTGTFADNEAIQVGGVTKATAAAASILFGSPVDANNLTWARLAITTARALILAVPGEGRILGVWMLAGVVYAWRNNVGSTAAVMYKSTVTGWSAVALGLTLPFTSGGTYEILAGDTITGATSAATAVITRVVLTSGTWAGGTAAGYLVMASKTGNFAAENLNVGINLNVATIAANATAITFPANGRYEFVNHNFYATSGTNRMYGVNGVGKAFEYDGTIMSPISTGQTTDTPIHIAVHRERLFLGFRLGVMDCSIVGSPQIYSGVLGAAEFGMGAEITNMVGEVLDTLFVFATDRVKVLYGSTALGGTDPFQLKPLSSEAGAKEWTAQNTFNVTYMDDAGVRNTNATQAYGNFNVGALSQSVKPLLDAKKKAGVAPIASLRYDAKSQYRLFFDDGTGLFFYLGKTKNIAGSVYPTPEILAFDLEMVVRCTCSEHDTLGNERLFMGSDDGYVYELDAGTSLDGDPLISSLRLAFDASKSPSQNKCYLKATLGVDKPPLASDGRSDLSLLLSAEFSNADPNQPPVRQQSFAISGGGGFYDEADWNNFYWSESVYGRAEAYIDGLGFNISLSIFCEATFEAPHTIHDYELQYSYRGLQR